MLGRTYDSQVCSIARALEVVGERWTLLILRNAVFAGTTRFRDFQHSLGIATNVLANRLDALVDSGLMERSPALDRASGHLYVLTDKGRDLTPVLIELTEWGDRWAAPDGPPIHYVHDACGSPVATSVHCASCGPLTDPAGVVALPGPGMPPDRAARVTLHAEQLLAGARS